MCLAEICGLRKGDKDEHHNVDQLQAPRRHHQSKAGTVARVLRHLEGFRAHPLRVDAGDTGPADEDGHDGEAGEDEGNENGAGDAQQHESTEDKSGKRGEDGDDCEGPTSAHVVATARTAKGVGASGRAFHISTVALVSEESPTNR